MIYYKTEMDNPKYRKYRIAEFTHWVAYLHMSQYYLGRTYLWLKRDGVERLGDLTMDEAEECLKLVIKMEEAVEKSFQATHFNEAHLGNENKSFHVHIIPRYNSPRHFAEITFTDEHWGLNHSPYDRSFETSEEVLQKIRRKIKKALYMPKKPKS